jgi:hypothetical protein
MADLEFTKGQHRGRQKWPDVFHLRSSREPVYHPSTVVDRCASAQVDKGTYLPCARFQHLSQ